MREVTSERMGFFIYTIMNELVISNNGQVMTTSILVAEKFHKEHKNVIQSIQRLTAENSAVLGMFYETTYINSQNKKQPMYVMTRDGFSLLVMGFTGADALQFKLDFINAFNQMEAMVKNNTKIPALPATYAEALRQLAEKVENEEKLLAEKAENAPKVEFYETVTGSTDTVDMSTVAKVLNMGIGRNRLFELLRNKGILMPNNQPYQRYVDSGWFRQIESKYNKPDGSTCINIKTVVYQKGIDAIRRILAKELEG